MVSVVPATVTTLTFAATKPAVAPVVDPATLPTLRFPEPSKENKKKNPFEVRREHEEAGSVVKTDAQQREARKLKDRVNDYSRRFLGANGKVFTSRLLAKTYGLPYMDIYWLLTEELAKGDKSAKAKRARKFRTRAANLKKRMIIKEFGAEAVAKPPPPESESEDEVDGAGGIDEE